MFIPGFLSVSWIIGFHRMGRNTHGLTWGSGTNRQPNPCYFADMDVVDLRDFYAQRLGTVARRFIARGIRARWTNTASLRVLGIGYATPYLGLFREEAERCLALMPAPQGVVRWPSSKPALAALVEEDDLPLTDAAVDRVLLVHALENSADPIGLLREVWRVLAGGGRLLAVVPNRRGLWARMDTTPFGSGRPYSRSQITHLLRETWFTPTGWGEALYVPPVSLGLFLRSAAAWERAGATISAPFAGVHIVEATKQVYRAIPARRERRRLMPALKPVLIPSPGAVGASRSFAALKDEDSK
jgi:SAM-dependent methyltransferase